MIFNPVTTLSWKYKHLHTNIHSPWEIRCLFSSWMWTIHQRNLSESQILQCGSQQFIGCWLRSDCNLPRGRRGMLHTSIRLYTSVRQSNCAHVRQSLFRCTTKLSYTCTATLSYTSGQDSCFYRYPSYSESVMICIETWKNCPSKMKSNALHH